MKNINKKIFVVAVALFACFSLYLTPIFSSSVTINQTVPTAKGWQDISAGSITGNSAGYGSVKLTLKTPEAVVFEVKAKKADGSWGPYTGSKVVWNVNQWYSNSYEYNLGKGTSVQARYQNFNWSLNSNQIEGTYNYH
ncbi:hypothetical protein MOZ60_10045 [Stecheria sp. CLA-KB-P133]|uniref:Uncharacterized protein n=1 Tax=Grylomicrobium aquisgranensis TaxID=2926318 RepID=A0AB35U4J6_9FIRM|nr:hypothetical protein [Stecheria sp. CLA-KB-P133]